MGFTSQFKEHIILTLTLGLAFESTTIAGDIKQVDQFRCLGAIIVKDGLASNEKNRIETSKKVLECFNVTKL